MSVHPDDDGGGRVVLYHFTYPGRIESIRRLGITRGDVPTSPAEGFNAPWLTGDPNPDMDRQGWACTSPLMGSKTGARLTVHIPADDAAEHLWPWRSLADVLGIDPEWRQALNRAGGGGEANWYVWCRNGGVPAEWIVKAEIMGH